MHKFILGIAIYSTPFGSIAPFKKSFMRDTCAIADEVVNGGVCDYTYFMLSHSHKDEINVSDDLTQKGSIFQSEPVLGSLSLTERY